MGKNCVSILICAPKHLQKDPTFPLHRSVIDERKQKIVLPTDGVGNTKTIGKSIPNLFK
jgi:hypothetical protein